MLYAGIQRMIQWTINNNIERTGKFLSAVATYCIVLLYIVHNIMLWAIEEEVSSMW